MANTERLAIVKQLIGWVYKTREQIATIFSDKKVSTFEALSIATISIEAANLVKVSPEEIKKLKKLTKADIAEIVDYIIADFRLVKNKPLEAQIIKTVRWVQSTYDMADGWKQLKK